MGNVNYGQFFQRFSLHLDTFWYLYFNQIFLYLPRPTNSGSLLQVEGILNTSKELNNNSINWAVFIINILTSELF